MSDFESEHDSDSSDEAAPNKDNRPVSSDGGVPIVRLETEDTTCKLKQGDSNIGAQESSRSKSKDGNNVADLTADFLAELKQAGQKTGRTNNQQDVEPWQLYLQEGEAAASYKYQDPNDGTIYEWDAEKRAWFPKVKNFPQSISSKDSSPSTLITQLPSCNIVQNQ